MSAFYRQTKIYLEELHHLERPTAVQSALLSNLNRNPKKSKPVKPSDYYLYEPKDLKQVPGGRYGAAALWLIANKMFPPWALFCYKELVDNASETIPTLVAFIGDGALLLAPTYGDHAWTGMLIATEVASDKWLDMKSPCGRSATLLIPKMPAKYWAKEDITLPCREAN
jgi:hypothetical protein